MEIIQYWARVPTPHTDPLWQPCYGTLGRNYRTIARSCTRRGASAATRQADARRHIGAGRHAAPGAGTGVDPRQMAKRSAAAAQRGRFRSRQASKTSFSRSVPPWPTRGPATARCTSERQLPLGSIDADSLLGVSLARNQKAIRTSALHMGFSPDLVWLIGELGSAPLAYHCRLA